jgi:hypothetical protein
MSDMDEIIEGMRKLGFLCGNPPTNAKPIPAKGGPTVTMFRPTADARIEDPADREHFQRIIAKMRELGLLRIENGDDGDDDGDDGPYGPQGTGSYTMDGCIDDCDP